MAKGESSWDTKAQKKATFNFEPFAAGEYPCKLLTSGASIKTAKVTDKNKKPLPYIAFSVEAKGTATQEGGKDRKVFVNLFTSLKEDKNGGPPMPTREDQLIGLCDAVGQHPKFKTVIVHGQECLDPREVLKWLQTLDGEVVQGRIRIQAASGEFTARNVVAAWLAEEGEEKSEEGEDEESEDEEDSDAEESDDEDESDDADEDEDDDSDDDEDELEKLVKGKAKGKKSKK
jgi:hypothetical protein